MHALLGVHVNALDKALTLAPPRVPVTMPVFGTLFYGQVAFTCADDGVTLRLANFADTPTMIRALTIDLPADCGCGACVVEPDVSARIVAAEGRKMVLRDVEIAPGKELTVRWSVGGDKRTAV